jgi:nicotinate-nucleotide adenylyltransferase
MRVGFFGGSFDPPHRGHIALARLAQERLGLDRLLFAPVGAQPLKHEGRPSTPFEDRVAMVRLAIADEPGMEVSLADAPRADGRPNYTIDTIRLVRDSLKAGDSLFCLMGADSFLTIGKWHQSEDLLLGCDFVVASRPGFDLQKIAAALPGSISLAAEHSDLPGCLVIGLRDGRRGAAGEHSRLYLLPDLAEDISATEIRSELRARTHAEIPAPVADYIAAHRLYREEPAG